MTPKKDKRVTAPMPSTGPARMRLARFLAAAGVGSRRSCEELISAGRVVVNGETVHTPAMDVDPDGDKIHFDGRPLQLAVSRYLFLHKPPGVTCSMSDRHARKVVADLIPTKFGRLFPVGRLDRDSEGALICTNDGDFADRLMHPRYRVEKTYRVHIRGRMSPDLTKRLIRGVRDGPDFLRVQRAAFLARNSEGGVLELVLTQGHKREIRRLCSTFDLRVTRLVRTAIGPIRLGSLPPGKWRFLTGAEVRSLMASARLKNG